MSEQFFKNPNECLKWCLDHPGQRCRDGEGREVWFCFESNHFETNLCGGDQISSIGVTYDLLSRDYRYFDLATLRPVEPEPVSTEPQKPTLANLAALENWDWMVIELPGGSTSHIQRRSGWVALDYSQLQTALSAGWPVKFGRGEA